MLSKAAKTDDDLEDDDCDLGDALGGLTDMQKMNDLIKDLRQQNQNFVIEITPTKHMFFEYFYDDPILSFQALKLPLNRARVVNVLAAMTLTKASRM